MNILVTQPVGKIRNTFIPPKVEELINKLGNVEWNTTPNQFTPEVLREKIKDVDVCITGWGTPKFDKYILENANRLKIIAHTGGTVGYIASDELFEQGVRIISGNQIYAESVAEAVIAYSLASLREIPFYNREVHEGRWPEDDYYNEGLLGQTIGLIGFGMISKCLVKLLKPFSMKIKVHSNHLTDEDLKEYGIERGTLEEIFTTCKIISVHSALTPSTYHMIGRELLQMIPDGSLLINTARGSIIDETALAEELQKNRFKAVLDVYEAEPLPTDSKLRGLNNAILIPHMGGPTVDRREYATLKLIEDIKNFTQGKPLKLEISGQYAKHMTR